MAQFICEKQGRCCPHEFYDSIEQAISDSEGGVPCDHLIEVSPVRHGRWAHLGGDEWCCSVCGFVITTEGSWDKPAKKYCEDCGAKMDGERKEKVYES